MQLKLEQERIYSVSLEEIYMTAESCRSITATLKGGEICIYREEFSNPAGSTTTSTLIDKYSTPNRMTALLKAFSEYDFPIAEDEVGEGREDDFYILKGEPEVTDCGYWVLDFKSQEKSLYVKGWVQHECYSEILSILTEYFPQFAEIHKKGEAQEGN